MRLKDKVALITGGADGIGLACAERFVAEGARVALADINRENGEAAAARLDGAVFVPCDVASKAEVDAAVATTVAAHGRLDICVSNAGTIHSADFLDIDEADFDRVIAVNLKGVFLTGQAAARQMVAQGGGGVIINMSSVNAEIAIPNQVPYVTSKGGVRQMTKVMALSLASHGIRVNAIGPGSIRTAILDAVMTDKAARHMIMSRTPMGRLGEPAEIASVAAFLVSDDASYMTGQTIYPDGGRLVLNYTVPVADDD
jgi:NAD(P)-dependent dehydrogenase (short-subunit alcohol dehydrogenase family)